MIAIYTRSATKNNESIAVQKQERLSLVNGEEVVFYSDNGVSGIDMNKEGLQSLIESAKGGSIKKVIALDPARFSRNLFEVQGIENQLYLLGIDVEYVISGIDQNMILH